MKKMLLLFFTILSLTGIDITAMDKVHEVAKLDNFDQFATSVNGLNNTEVAKLIKVLLRRGLDYQHFTKPIEQQKIDSVIATINRKQIPYKADTATLFLLLEYGSSAQDHCISWVQFLLSHGLNVNASVNQWRQRSYILEEVTPLAFITYLLGEANVDHGTLIKIAKILLQRNANPNHPLRVVDTRKKMAYDVTPVILTKNITRSKSQPNNPGYNASIEYAKQMLPILENPALANEKTQKKNSVSDYAEKIKYIESALNPKSFSFSRLQTGLGMIAAAVTANVFYKWFTRKPAEHQQKNILINKTGAPIFITGQEEPIAANETFGLPQKGKIRIKLAKDQDASKDLVINIDAYADDLNDSYLNLIIYKKWFSSFFTVPLTTSEVWVDKSKTIPFEKGE